MIDAKNAINEAVKNNAAPTVPAPSIAIEGAWLIVNGIDKIWYETRGIGKWDFVPDGIVDGVITEMFRDRISIYQAESLGIVKQLC